MKRIVLFLQFLSCCIYFNHALLSYQLASLESLYHALNGTKWSYGVSPDMLDENRTWFNDAQVDPCEPTPWYGLTCSSDNTTIISMDMEAFNLVGAIPDNIFEGLNTTNSIIFYNNSIIGNLPSSLVAVKQTLTYLDMGQNFFEGSLPTWLGELTNLEVIWLNANQFVNPLPTTMCQMSNLTQLYAYKNYLVGTIPECIGDLNLSIFSVYKNYMTGK